MKRILTTLSEKWPEYILEIFVLIIGIYGAFAVDSWNDERKSDRAEYETLVSLKTDFEDRLDELIEIQNGREKILEAIDEIFKEINHQRITRPTSEIDSLLSYLNIQWTFNDQFSSLDMLLSTGKINELSNQELRHHLINWPSLIEEMLEEQRQYVVNIDALMSVLSQFVNINYLLEYVNIRGNAFGTQLKPGVFPSDHKGLIHNNEFVSELTEQRIYLYLNIQDGRTLIENASKIISLLEKETAK